MLPNSKHRGARAHFDAVVAVVDSRVLPVSMPIQTTEAARSCRNNGVETWLRPHLWPYFVPSILTRTVYPVDLPFQMRSGYLPEKRGVYLKGISTSVKLPGTAVLTAVAILSRCCRTMRHAELLSTTMAIVRPFKFC